MSISLTALLCFVFQIRHAILSSDNNLLVSATSNGVLSATSLMTRTERAPSEFFSHASDVSQVLMTSDNQRIVLLLETDQSRLVVLKPCNL